MVCVNVGTYLWVYYCYVCTSEGDRGWHRLWVWTSIQKRICVSMYAWIGVRVSVPTWARERGICRKRRFWKLAKCTTVHSWKSKIDLFTNFKNGNTHKMFQTKVNPKLLLPFPRSRVCFRIDGIQLPSYLPVWPDKYRQMSIKDAQKWFQLKNDRFWHLFKNCLKMWEIWANKLLPKALISGPKSNSPIWSHCYLPT